MKKIYLAVLVSGMVLQITLATAADPESGARAYKLCAGCHGFKGEGSEAANAPGIAGQEDWYLSRQIENFRNGVRGADSGDTHGQTMAKMTRTLKSDADVADLVAYIETLPAALGAADTIAGDAAQGQQHYAACAACHGAAAEGNAALNAPALARMDDWYLLAQLRAFQSGLRGSDPADVYGQQMAPMAATLTDEQAMNDIVAYIATLR